jgi:hypothetical protein
MVEREVRLSGDSFKGTVNRLLKLGLIASKKPLPAQPFVVTPFQISSEPGRNYDNIGELLEQLEGPDHR